MRVKPGCGLKSILKQYLNPKPCSPPGLRLLRDALRLRPGGGSPGHATSTAQPPRSATTTCKAHTLTGEAPPAPPATPPRAAEIAAIAEAARVSTWRWHVGLSLDFFKSSLKAHFWKATFLLSKAYFYKILVVLHRQRFKPNGTWAAQGAARRAARASPSSSEVRRRAARFPRRCRCRVHVQCSAYVQYICSTVQ